MAISGSRMEHGCRFGPIIASICAAIVIAVPAHAGAVLFVDDNAPPGGDGATWDSAFRYLQDALYAAQPGSGVEEIRIGQGTYQPDRDESGFVTPCDREATFRLIDGVSLMGGYAGYGAPDPDERNIEAYETILSGDLLGDDEYQYVNNDENSYQVMTAGDESAPGLLEGLVFTAGNANIDAHDHGAGLRAGVDSSVTASQCIFRLNWAEYGAGAGAVFSSLTLNDCTFVHNHGDFKGGGVQCWYGELSMRNCVLEDNVCAYRGGGLHAMKSAVTVLGCRFESNRAMQGGGVHLDESAYQKPTVISRCVFLGNGASGTGGGLASFDASLFVTDCAFIGNAAWTGAAGIECSLYGTTGTLPMVINNCVFASNEASWVGGILVYGNPMVYAYSSITNCTFHNNTAWDWHTPTGGIMNGCIGLDITNCVLWDDYPVEIRNMDNGPYVVVSHSLVDGGWEGDGNIDTDPLFADPDGPDDVHGTEDDDLRLLADSPCIDAGLTMPFLDCLPDLDINHRVVEWFLPDPTVDMGAYEFGSTPTSDININGISDDCEADCDEDGLDDLIGVLVELRPDCNANLIPDWCDIEFGYSGNCNGNNRPDECDIALGYSEDCNENGVPDECEPDLDTDGDGWLDICDNCPDHYNPDQEDCDEDGVGDVCAIDWGMSEDCNFNEIPDECDIEDGVSEDCNGNGVPDECDLADAYSEDCNENGVPDECDIDHGISGDCDLNGVPDECEQPFWLPDPVSLLSAPDGLAGDEFGGAVAISGDTLVVGAPFDDDNGPASGSAYVFVWNATNWMHQDKLLPTDGKPGARFGCSVAIHGDVVVVGAETDDDNGPSSGAAYAFRRQGVVWEQIEEFHGQDPQPFDYLGRSVAVSTNTIAVGAEGKDANGVDSGAVFIYERQGTDWIPRDFLFSDEREYFGSSVAVHGELLVVGAREDDDNGSDSGSAYVFSRGIHYWELVAKLLPSDGMSGDQFGCSVEMSGDTIIVGADGDDNNGTDSGSVYVFASIDDDWIQWTVLQPEDASDHDYFGSSVDISGDNCVVGAWGSGQDWSGAAYVFSRQGIHWLQNTRLVADDPAAEDLFGSAVAIDQYVAVIGAPWDDDNGSSSGTVRTFLSPGPDCNENDYPDECDILDGLSEDCNNNGVPDECDVIAPAVFDSGELSPIGDGYPQSLIIESAPTALSDVILDFTAFGDFSAPSSERIIVDINGVQVGDVFTTNCQDCPEIPHQDQLIVPGSVYNDAVGDGDAAINMVATYGVDPFQCNDPSYIAVVVSLYRPSDTDLNENGVPDECECPADLNDDGKVDECDIFDVLELWGTCGDCPEDINGDGLVDIDDVFAVLAFWGPCP